MSEAVLWVLFLFPTQECLDRIEKQNYSKCEKRSVEVGGLYFSGQDRPREERLVCDKVDNPVPTPQKSFKIMMDYPEKTWDDCYEASVSSIPASAEKWDRFGPNRMWAMRVSSSSIFSAWNSTVTVGGAIDGGRRGDKRR